MSRKIAIDFGTSNTVVSTYDDSTGDGRTVHIPKYGHYLEAACGMSVIPSVIYYGDGQEVLVGDQVIERNLYHSTQTFRWMKRYIQARIPTKRWLGKRHISNSEAGRDFLTNLLRAVPTSGDESNIEAAVTVPVESFEHYEEWLNGVAEQSGIRRLRLIDEPIAAAVGYGTRVQPNDTCLVFDFGGGTLDVAIVIFAEPDDSSSWQCRVLGKAGADLGGSNIDQWMFEEILKQNSLNPADTEVDQISGELLRECERAKERLSQAESATVTVMNPFTGGIIESVFTQETLEKLLEDRSAFQQIDSTISRAMSAANLKGFEKSDIKTVLLVGGCSFIPCVQQTLRRMFGKDRVLLDRPLDAVARGAAKILSGANFLDFIQHDYAVKYMNTGNGQYEYRTIVKMGTPYPSQSLANIDIKATYEGQKHFGLAIFEISRSGINAANNGMELIFDADGHARVIKSDLTDLDRDYFWINESCPTFLTADPPAAKGQICFRVEFSIDDNKRLLMSAKDANTSKLLYENYPVIKLQ